jgi:hypothetical protein
MEETKCFTFIFNLPYPNWLTVFILFLLATKYILPLISNRGLEHRSMRNTDTYLPTAQEKKKDL